MIVKIENGQIKNIKISCSSKFLDHGEMFVPDDWGTVEIRDVFLNDEPNVIDQDGSHFAIKKDPNVPFFLFEIGHDKDISNGELSNCCIGFDSDFPFSLFDVSKGSRYAG